MVSVETLECRRFMTESELFVVEGRLAADLKAVEAEVDRLHEEVDRLVEATPRTPIEHKAYRLARAISSVARSADVADLIDQACLIENLKAQLQDFDRQIAEYDGHIATVDDLVAVG